jgi:hypothetical protein
MKRGIKDRGLELEEERKLISKRPTQLKKQLTTQKKKREKETLEFLSFKTISLKLPI